jgi:two-component system OmpR family response regulator
LSICVKLCICVILLAQLMSLSHNKRMQSDTNKILIVDDDPDIREMLSELLEEEGFRTQSVSDPVSIDTAIAQFEPDLILLDLMLPNESGLTICQRLRTNIATPIIMVTAKASEIDRVVGLEIGADDYITKPFSKRELIARVRAVLRRGAHELAVQPSMFAFKDLLIDLDSRTLKTLAGELIPLTSAEFDLLACFVGAPQKVLSRDHLLRTVLRRKSDLFDRSVDTLVSRLRKKIERPEDDEKIIATIRQQGYLFTPKVQPAAP